MNITSMDVIFMDVIFICSLTLPVNTSWVGCKYLHTVKMPALMQYLHVVASRTGGVAEIQRRMQDLAEGKKPSPPAKQQTKVQEIAEQVSSLVL